MKRNSRLSYGVIWIGGKGVATTNARVGSSDNTVRISHISRIMLEEVRYERTERIATSY